MPGKLTNCFLVNKAFFLFNLQTENYLYILDADWCFLDFGILEHSNIPWSDKHMFHLEEKKETVLTYYFLSLLIQVRYSG